jgi:hypothetical protein
VRTPAEEYRDKGYELVMRYGTEKEKLEAKARRTELNAWPGRRDNLVRVKQGRAS